MKTIHLRDNSWYVSESNEFKREELRYLDTYHRKPEYLKQGYSDILRVFSESTIGELIESERSDVLVWPNSFYEGNEDLMKQHIFSITTNGKTVNSVTTSNVVGFIGTGQEDIRIHSRFSTIDNKGKGNDSFLYYMLEKVLSINTLSYTSSSSFNDPQVFDLLLFFFPSLLKGAMSLGLYKKYVYRNYNDSNIRGAVDVSRHLRFNIPANGKIAYRTREFSYDNSITQLIRHTIEFLRRQPLGMTILHNDPDMEGCVEQIIQATPSYESRQRQYIINENLRPVFHPYYTKYTALQKLCLRILRYERLSYGENNDKIRGILIDASWLWEEYVARVLSENDALGLKHYTRKGSPFHLLVNGDNHFQKIIPDYLDVDKKLVADAKYIPLVKDELSADRAAPVYYKTIMYMYRFDAKHGFLFHPVSRKKADDTNVITASEKESFTFCDYSIEGRPGCHLFKVGLVVDIQEDQSEAINEDEWKKYREIMSNREKAFVYKIMKVIQ